jgi:hypothetical protein
MSAPGRRDVAPLIRRDEAGSIIDMRVHRRLWFVLALVGSSGAAAAVVEGCSSTSTAPNGEGVQDSGSDTSVEDAVADVVSTPDSTASDGGDAGPDAGSTGDGGCPADGAVPDDLSCTGLYADWATKTIAPEAVAYTPGLVFWSDGAVKTRWIYLPPGGVIDTSDMDNWVFPVGTKIWKQFALGGQIVETRLIWKTDAGWTYLDYLWSADGSSAKRFDDGETNVNGTTYEIPSTSVCQQCHGGRADAVLGVDLLGTGVAGAAGVTLAGLADAGRLSQAPSHTTIAIPEDATKKAAAALGWLHVNCGSSCHNASGKATATHLYMKLLAAQLQAADGGAGLVGALDTYTTAVNVAGKVTPNGMSYERIAPGDAAHSLIPLMALSRDMDSGFLPMPPLVSHVPDTDGEAPVSAWINALGDAGQ